MLAFFKAPFAVTALALLLTVPGQSAVITLNFTGTVTGVADAQNHFGGAISNGESYTGWVKYDTSAYLANSFLLGSTPTVDYEINNLASTLPVMMSFQVGSNSFTATVATGHADEIEVRADGDVLLVSNSIVTSPDPGFSHSQFEVLGRHTPANSTALPGVAQLSTQASDWAVELFYGTYPSNYSDFNLSVQSLTIAQDSSAAPEPGTAGLALACGAALAAIAVVRNRASKA